MVRLLLLSIALLSSIGSIIGFERSPDDPLLLVQVVIRHADRAAMHGYVTNNSAEVFFRGNGELSDAGIDNAFLQGVDYRKRYVDTGFVDKRMLTNQIHIRSSGVPRVLMSASAFTSALFEKTSGGQSKVPPIFTKETETDPLLVPPLDCLDGWEDVIAKYGLPTSKEAERIKRAKPLAPSRKYAKALEAMLAREMPEECKMVPPSLLEAIVAELPNPLISLPKEWLPCANNGAKQLMFKYMELLSGAGADFNQHRLQRTAGLLTAELLDNMAAMLNCTLTECAEPKFRVYYTHDVNVLAASFVFDALSLFEGKTPAFSSSLVFELRNSKFGPYVNIFLKNGQAAPFIESDLCTRRSCMLDAVIEMTKAYAIREPARCILNEADYRTSTTPGPAESTTKDATTSLSTLAVTGALIAVRCLF